MDSLWLGGKKFTILNILDFYKALLIKFPTCFCCSDGDYHACEAYSSKLEVGTSFSSRADLRTEQQTAFAVKRRREGKGRRSIKETLKSIPSSLLFLPLFFSLFAGDVDASKQAKN